MKKLIVLFSMFAAMSFFTVGARVCAQECPQKAGAGVDAEQLAQDFVKTAMAEFKSINDIQMSYAQVSSEIQKYSLNMAKVLLDSGIEPETARGIMQGASALYGQALKAIFNGGDYNAVIQDYSFKVSDLFSKNNLNIETQSKIVSSSSDNLESMGSLFKDLKNEDY